MTRIESVTVFVSERIIQTIVFGVNGKQLPECQGSNFENYKEIILRSHTTTDFYLGVWKKTHSKIDMITYEKLAKAFNNVYQQKEIINYFGDSKNVKIR